MRFLASAALIASMVVLASCVPQPRAPAPAPAPPPRPVPVPRPAPPPAAPASSDWRDWPITPGTWSYASRGAGATASFGQPGTTPLLTLRCDKGANAVHLIRAGDARGTGFTVRTSTTMRALPVEPTGSGATTAVLKPDDRLLDAIGFSRGRFVLESPPLGTLVVPAWPEILRVVEDCRG